MDLVETGVLLRHDNNKKKRERERELVSFFFVKKELGSGAGSR